MNGQMGKWTGLLGVSVGVMALLGGQPGCSLATPVAAPINLTADSPSDDANPAWSPDGQQILFSTRRAGGSYNLWLMEADGSHPHPLTEGDDDSVNMPGTSWNPVTGRICFSSDRSGDDEIWSMEADGSGRRRITHHPEADWEPTWSPDGQWLVFQSDRGGDWDIYRIKADGTGRQRLTDDPADDWQPNWAPRDGHIVFQSDRTGNWDVWVMDADGANPRNVTDDPAEDTDPSWSPDGRFIVYSSDRDGGEEGDVWLIAADGHTQPQRVTHHPAYDGAPAFSPDGRLIAFESDRSGNLDLWVMGHPLAERSGSVEPSTPGAGSSPASGDGRGSTCLLALLVGGVVIYPHCRRGTNVV